MTKTRILIDQLTELETIKTWSLIVTLLGDVESHCLPGKEIGNLLGHIGIKPEAVRVALHRLKRDGWIVTTKNGREVVYRLSDSGQTETEAVYNDVYRVDVKYADGWKLQLTEVDVSQDQNTSSTLRLFKNVRIRPVVETCDGEDSLDLTFDADNLPAWFSDRIMHPDVVERAKNLTALVNTFQAIAEPVGQLDSSSVRLLVLHHWRKMALRDETWAHISLFPKDATAHCHSRVTSLLMDLPRYNWQ